MKAFIFRPRVLAGLTFLLIAASFLFLPSQELAVQSDKVFMPPSPEHWLGTDSLGRDYLSRVLLGFRISLIVSVMSCLVSGVLGVFVGSWIQPSSRGAGFLASRGLDLLQGMPSFMMIAILMQTRSEPSVWELGLVMGLFHWPALARLTQSQVFKVQNEPYIEAARALGAGRFYILRVHVWPSCYNLWKAWLFYHLPTEIMFESSLSFLGFGVQAPDVSLGLLIQESWQYLSIRPLYLIIPSVVMMALVLILQRGKVASLFEPSALRR